MADLPASHPCATCQRPIWTGKQCGACAGNAKETP